MRPRLRGLVLAAGLGTRLRPLTDAIPKPLLPVLGKSLLARSLDALAAVGCDAVAINLHHHGDQIRHAFGDSYAGLPLTWSVEPRLLGTLGALEPLHDFFAGAAALLIVNGDSLCQWPLARLLERHQANDAAATLLLASRPDPADFGGGVAVDRSGAILSFRVIAGAADDTKSSPREPSRDSQGSHRTAASTSGEPRRMRRRCVFAGAHVLSPRLLARIQSRAAADAVVADIVRDLYEPLLVTEGPPSLGSLTTGRHWHDLGTPQRFHAASLDWLAARRQAASSSWIAPGAVVAERAVVRGSSLEAGCRVGAGASIEESVVLSGAVVGAGSVVRGSILGPGALVADGDHVSGRCMANGSSRPLAADAGQ
jgi:mannose-1-phosphate guanylyltransferase